MSLIGKSHLKIRDKVAQDVVFQEQVAAAMVKWKEIHQAGLDILTWWEFVVKPGVRNIALGRRKELNKEKRGELNMLLIQQNYLVKKKN